MQKPKPVKSPQQNEKLQPVGFISGKRLWLFRFIAVIVIPLVFFLLLEFSLRVFDFGYPSGALIETTDHSEIYVRENSAFAYRFFPKELAREFIPIRFKAEKPDNVFRIFILGGSAARGTPDPAYSFWRILDVMLQQSYPDIQFEVLCMAMPAINSHVVLEIAGECANYDPDLFIVYLGNNEVIGPYGPGTVLTPIISNHALLRLVIKLKATRTSQLLSHSLEKLNIRKPAQVRWKGMEMFLENQVLPNDPELEMTYRNFNDNLAALNQISRDNNIKVIYSTVASNLKDSAPFNSVHDRNLTSTDLQKWENLYTSASAYQNEGDYKTAITEYLAAAKIDSQYANLHFKLGRCYWHTGDFSQADASYKRARAYDANRFRADKRINEIIHHAATAAPGTAFLADALHEIEQESPHRIPGREFLLEHVHLNFEGNYLVAQTVFNQIENVFSDVFKNQKKDATSPLSDARCAADLVYSRYEQYHILDLVLNKFIKEPPFTNQLYHSETVTHLEGKLDSLQHVIRSQDPKDMISAYEKAILKRASDWWLHFKYAEFLADKLGEYQKAADHFQFVINTIPHDASAYVTRGSVLAKLGQFKEALDHFKKALSINPTIAEAYFNSGLIYQKQGKLGLAVENYQQTVFYEPKHAKAYNNLAFIFTQQGNSADALATIEQGLIASPNDLHLNYNKAMILYQNNHKEKAIEQLRHVIRLAPNEVTLQEQLNKWLKEETN